MELFRTRWVLELSIFYILVGGISWSAQVFFNQNFAVDLGLTPVEAGWIFSVARVINAILVWRLAHASWMNPRRAFLFYAIILVVAYVPGFWANKWLGILLIAISTFISTSRFVILGQYCNREFRSKNRATALSALNMGVSVFYVGAMVVGGGIMQQHTTRLVFTLLGVLSLVVVWPLTYALLRKH